MNRAFRLIFDKLTGRCVVAPETAKGHGKASAAKTLLGAALVLASGLCVAAAPTGLPEGGTVTSGTASISTNGNTMTVDQSTAKTAINWSSFNIAPAATVVFNQPSSSAIALNRVTGSDPSAIYGKLQANGQVFLLNPNGILFGRTAEINVGGLVASTLSLSDSDFNNGNYRFQASGTPANVTNQGSITAAPGGFIALMGGNVVNEGNLIAKVGSVGLASGNDITLSLLGNGLINLQIDQGTYNALVENHQLIDAGGGLALLTAKGASAAVAAVVNNTGIISADTLVAGKGGDIRLEASNSETDYSSSGGVKPSMVINSGKLSAVAQGAYGASTRVFASASSILQAGEIRAEGTSATITLNADKAYLQVKSAETSAYSRQQPSSLTLTSGEHAYIAGKLSANGSSSGGFITVNAGNINLASAHLQANGATGAGSMALNASSTQNGPPRQFSVSADTVLEAHGGSGRPMSLSTSGYLHFAGTIDASLPVVQLSAGEDLVFSGKLNLGNSAYSNLSGKNVRFEAPHSGLPMYFSDPVPGVAEFHGSGGVSVLSNGNVVVASPEDRFGANRGGAVYLYDGSTGALLSAVFGRSQNDALGSGGITRLDNGHYVVTSPEWNSGSPSGHQVGAVAWGSATWGINGVLAARNAFVGSQERDKVGSGGVTPLVGGNYVISSPNWKNEDLSNAGAATWAAGTGGHQASGIVSVDNSLVGDHGGDQVSLTLTMNPQTPITPSITALSNGHYVVSSFRWNSSAGAATWGNGTTGIRGYISSANSLIGPQAGDQVGLRITALSNGHYVVASPYWNGSKGAVTWANGANGTTVGSVSETFSLTGQNNGDYVGLGTLFMGNTQPSVVALTNGKYVVLSPFWNQYRGAATLLEGDGPFSAYISSYNSLIGNTPGDLVGQNAIALSNGNYVVASPSWSGIGAATWGNGTTGTFGQVTTNNSLTGSASGDAVGSALTALSNGNYLVLSPSWSNGDLRYVGAVTWGNGATGLSNQVVSINNSLVGNSASDRVGSGGIVSLSNGNYLVLSPNWSRSIIQDGELTTVSQVGSVTWADGQIGSVGVVSGQNSLIGSFPNERLSQPYSRQGKPNPSVFALSNGHYVVVSQKTQGPNFILGDKLGSIFRGNGLAGSQGEINYSNALLGDTQFYGPNVIIQGSAGNDGQLAISLPHLGISEGGNLGTAVLLDGNAPLVGTLDPAQPGSPLANSPVQLSGITNVTATNNVTVSNEIQTSGRLFINAAKHVELNAQLLAQATETAIDISTGDKFINTAGATALSAPNGRWLVKSNSPNDVTKGGLRSDFRHYNLNESSLLPTSGNGFVYRSAPGTLTVDASGTGSSSYYGDDPQINIRLSGFADNEDSIDNIGLGGTARWSGSVSSRSNVGEYNVGYLDGYTSQLGYGFQAGSSIQHQVKPREITVTALEQRKIYGDPEPALRYQVGGMGLRNDDLLSGALASPTGPDANAGTHTISQGSLSASGNYRMSFVNGTLTVDKAPLHLTANNFSKTYGEADPRLTYSVNATDLRYADSTAVVSGVTFNAPTGAQATAGTHDITLGGGSAANYALSFSKGTLAVAQANLRVAADSFSKTYGEADPRLTYAVNAADLKYTDSAAVVSGITFNAPTGAQATAGTHDITLGGGSAANYALSFSKGSLTVAKANLRVAADSFSKTYGEADPRLTYSVNAADLKYTDSAAVVSGVTFNAPTGAQATAGTHDITLGGGTAANYALSFSKGSLAVAKAGLTVAALDASKEYGSSDPLLTVSASGLRYGETMAETLTGVLVRASGENPGTYQIAQGSMGAGNNYVLSYRPGTFTIKPVSELGNLPKPPTVAPTATPSGGLSPEAMLSLLPPAAGEAPLLEFFGPIGILDRGLRAPEEELTP